MNLIRERFQIVGGAKAVVELSSISNPITVIGISVSTARTVVVLRDRADPDCARLGNQLSTSGEGILTGSETCILDVVQVLTNGIPGTTAPRLCAWVAFGRVSAVWKGVTVGNDPVADGKCGEVGKPRSHALVD